MPGHGTNGGGSAVAKSAFLTVPAGGVPASSGRDDRGQGRIKNGNSGADHLLPGAASGGCKIVLRLSATETLSGGRIVSVAARRTAGARRSAAALRHLTLTLASARVRLARGCAHTIALGLSATAGACSPRAGVSPRTLLVSGTGDRRDPVAARQELIALGPPTRAGRHANLRR